SPTVYWADSMDGRHIESEGTVKDSVIIDVFFFSSRRRHTRLQGDWSSDVCSSDLRRKMARWLMSCDNSRTPMISPPPGRMMNERSEERRVGKECRSRRTKY